VATTTPVMPGPGRRLVEGAEDLAVMTRRDLLVWRRTPAFLVFTLVQPVIFVLLFRYVFGGAIQVGNAGGYVDYLMPGIIGQTAGFASVATAIALARGLHKGVIDRFRSMPMARSAYLGGRLLADTLRMLVTLVVILVVGYAVGFRFVSIQVLDTRKILFCRGAGWGCDRLVGCRVPTSSPARS